MKLYPILILTMAALAMPASAKQKPLPPWPALGVETSLVFPRTTVRKVKVDGEQGFWVQDQQRRWYYGRFSQPCQRMKGVMRKALDGRGAVRFDRASVLWVRGQNCALEHFVTASEPPKRSKKNRKDQQQ